MHNVGILVRGRCPLLIHLSMRRDGIPVNVAPLEFKGLTPEIVEGSH